MCVYVSKLCKGKLRVLRRSNGVNPECVCVIMLLSTLCVYACACSELDCSSLIVRLMGGFL